MIAAVRSASRLAADVLQLRGTTRVGITGLARAAKPPCWPRSLPTCWPCQLAGWPCRRYLIGSGAEGCPWPLRRRKRLASRDSKSNRTRLRWLRIHHGGL